MPTPQGTTLIHPPTIETDLSRNYELPLSPPDDVVALRETSGDRLVWERSRIHRHTWFCAQTRQVATWRELIARDKRLTEYHVDVEVWVVRTDGKAPFEVWEIYSNEPAAIAAAGGSGDRRAQPWIVRHTPYEEGPDGTGA